MKRKTLVSLLLLLSALFSPKVAQAAYCPPFFATVDSIDPKTDCLEVVDRKKSCGGAVEVINNCPGDVLFYKIDGTLDESLVLVNKVDWLKNQKKYQEVEKNSGIRFRYAVYRTEPSHVLKCNKNDKDTYSEKECLTVDTSKYKNGDIAKNWEIRLYNKKDNQNILVKGRTTYQFTEIKNDFRLYLLLAIVIGGVALFMDKFLLKPKG